jgi:hypothetical protein
MGSKLNILSKKIVLLFIIIFCGIAIKAQEYLIAAPTQFDDEKNQQPNRLKAGATLELPFLDDFSKSFFNPDPNKWTDNYVFINSTYAINPPSIGVATFDAVDNNGEFYKTAGYGITYSSDTLTSQPINLNYPSDNTIFLSFYFQPQGVADNPEVSDSLLLDFYDVTAAKWNNVWKQAGSNLTSFQFKIIHINSAIYLKDGFRFRFRNKASISNNSEPSRIMNCDHWNIDYVYLNRGRNINDIITNDIAFNTPLKSVLKNYESMPWKHYLADRSNQFGSNTFCSIRNNYNITIPLDTLYFVIHDNSGSNPNDTLIAGSHDIKPLTDSVFNPPFDRGYNFFTNSTDSASFNLKARIGTNSGDPRMNNEVVYVQKFYDYYAYDDGSAESGYGFKGVKNAQLAYRFNCIKEDTLKAIQMYFNRAFKDENKQYFFLTIWNDNNGQPGQIIYKRQGVMPEFENELNKFHTYFIDDAEIVLSGVFYVGWIQTTEDNLLIGADINRDNRANTFYNISGQWVNSSYPVALMIRPFFGKNLTTNIEPPKVVENTIPNVKIYPNPAKDEIKIDIDNQADFNQIEVSIFNLLGAMVLQSKYSNNQPISISELVPGTYIIRLTDKTRKLNFSKKIIKQN